MIGFDTETTGLDKPEACDLKIQPYLTEFYAAKFNYDGVIYAEYNTLIKPPVPIPEIVTKLTGIDDNMVKNAPTFIEVYDDIAEFFVGEKTVFAHNCAFDLSMLRHELKRYDLEYNFPWPPYHCCTVEASFAIKNRRLTLEALWKLATGKEERKVQHRAKNDVKDMIDCICWLKKEGFIHEIFN